MRLIRWLRALIAWLAEPRLFWRTVLMLAFALAFPLLAGMAEWQIRLSGLFLQLLGLGTVAYGLRETRKLFSRPTVAILFREWLARVPRWRGRVVQVAGTARLIVRASGRGHVWTPMDPAAPAAEQLRALTNNVERLNQRTLEMQSALDAHQRVMAGALHGEQEARSQADSELQARLEAAQAGGLYISLAGLIWLLFGLLMGTLSNDIALAAK